MSRALILFLLLACSCFAEVPLLKDAPIRTAGQLDKWNTVQSADDAYELGLYSVANRLYSKALLNAKKTSEIKYLKLRLSSIAIHKGQYDKAREILSEYPDGKDASFYLRQSLIGISSGVMEAAELALESTRFDALPTNEQAWYYFAKGQIEEYREKFDASIISYAQARSLSTSEPQKRHIETYIIINQILHHQIDSSLEENLKTKVERYRGEQVGFTFAMEYAVMLHQSEKSDDALRLLDEQFIIAQNLEAEELDDILLLIALISGIDTPKTQLALETLLQSGKQRSKQRIGLRLLAQSMQLSKKQEAFIQLLDRLLNTKQTNPEGALAFSDELLLFRARMKYESQDFEGAEKDAQQILELYPQSLILPSAQRLLAYLALKNEPPQYRTAANYLSKSRLILPKGIMRTRIGMMIGDCYFLNGDIENAENFYQETLNEGHTGELHSQLIYQVVLSMLKQNKLDEAQKAIDAHKDKLNNSERWQAEWNLLHTMRSSGQNELANKRASQLIVDGENENIPFLLRLRLLWLQALLSFENEDYTQTTSLADQILKALSSQSTNETEASQRTLIASHTLHLKARAHFRLGNEDIAIQTFQQLRSAYAGTGPDIRSYIDEARFHMANNKPAAAQKMLIELADKHSTSEYAPAALYEASLAAESQGLERTYTEGTKLLERLINQYPDNQIVFHARMKQGDLLRKLNQFSAAQSRYDEAIKSFPKHPGRPWAELSIGHCLLARGSENNDFFNAAVSRFERLYELSDMPFELRIEAGYLYAETLQKLKRKDQAINILWSIISRYKDVLQNEKTRIAGAYWVSRTAFTLGDILEQDGQKTEAAQLYRFVIDNQLPGIELANAQLKRLNNI